MAEQFSNAALPWSDAEQEFSNVERQLCAICLESPDLILMPCCGREESTTRFCQPCIQVVCQMADGGYGKCPKCRHTISMVNGTVTVAEPRGQCRMCRQGGKIIVDQGLCEACLLGSRYVFNYECDRCHRTQRIPHPMWRYQETPDSFGGATWACHRGCGSYTHWRILPDDLLRVPVQERPASWGNEEWFARIREMRRRGSAVTGSQNRRSQSACSVS
mmetsp:Transcript_32824/g.54018  ORF Transcript_32824/g.54018 Transcript_32824/m.54018 type:complete len:218 (+) Transcript_32824:62-715(+)